MLHYKTARNAQVVEVQMPKFDFFSLEKKDKKAETSAEDLNISLLSLHFCTVFNQLSYCRCSSLSLPGKNVN